MLSAFNIKQFGNIAHDDINLTRHIIIVAQELDNPFWRLVEQGAKGAELQYQIKVDYMGPMRNNQAEQMRLLEKAIAASPDGIIVQGIQNESYLSLIDLAYQNSIPILTVDADVSASHRLAYIGTNQREAGKQLGEQLIKHKNVEEVKIGVIVGSMEGENQKIRLEGLQQAISRDSSLEIVAIRPSNISRIKAAEETVQLLSLYPQINTFVGLSSLDGAGIVDGLKHVQREDIDVYAFDKLDITLDFIRNKDIKLTIAQQPELMGAQAIHMLMHYFDGESIASEQFIDTMTITQSSIEEK